MPHCNLPSDSGLEKWLELNREYAQKWPNITAKKDVTKDAKAHWDETGKFESTFRPSRVRPTEQTHLGNITNDCSWPLADYQCSQSPSLLSEAKLTSQRTCINVGF